MAEAVRVDRAPRVDGTLHDPLWQSANPITDFRQREPHEGEPPTEKRKCAFSILDTPCTSEFIAMTQNRLESSQRNSGAT